MMRKGLRAPKPSSLWDELPGVRIPFIGESRLRQNNAHILVPNSDLGAVVGVRMNIEDGWHAIPTVDHRTPDRERVGTAAPRVNRRGLSDLARR
jgi:hypothetical protein